MNPTSLICVAALAAVFSAALPVFAEHGSRADYPADAIVIRRTIPDPFAAQRQPLTSDRLSTTSTRYIDARRGFRPYSAVHGHACLGQNVIVGYDDNFGITRPEDRPYSYANRAPRTGVEKFENRSDAQVSSAATTPVTDPVLIIIHDDRTNAATSASQDKASDKPDMHIRIHNDVPQLPSRSGAVIIAADGTVIQVGD